MSESNQDSQLRALRSRHAELISVLRKKDETIPTLLSTNRSNSISWLKKAIRGLEAQINTKRTKKTAPKSSVSTRKGKWSKAQANQFVKSYEQNYDEQSVKNIEHYKTLKKGSAKTRKAIKKFDEKTKVYHWLKKEFEL